MRRLRRCSTVLLAALVVSAIPATSATAAGVDPVGAAAGWLTTQFVGADHLPQPGGDHFDSKFGSSYFPNYGENADVIFGLAAAKVGASKAKVALNYLQGHLDDYADPSGAFGGPFDGALAKVALAQIVAGSTADDLLTMLKADECTKAGKCTVGAPANIFASASDSFVILAEARAGGSFAPSANAVDYFLSLQCANGGFTTGTDACGSGDADIDATSYALMALQALGGHAAEATKAADWLESQRNAAGYWIVQGLPNTNSTGLAAAALAGSGRDVSTSRSWLLDQQVGAGQPGAGSLKYGGKFTPTTTSATSPNVIATAQGILGLVANGSLATVTGAGSDANANLLSPVASLSDRSPAPGDTIAVTGVGYAAGEKVLVELENAKVTNFGSGVADASGKVAFEATLPAGAEPGSARIVVVGATTGLTVSIPVTVTVTSTGSGTPTPTPTGPPLANTGADTSELLALGLAALAAGFLLLGLGRRHRQGRHEA
jgi:LPXTG-motif cell wall-anchored protein